ncbi:MAG: chemotaxis protein CheC [Promethearchaeota archaeon]
MRKNKNDIKNYVDVELTPEQLDLLKELGNIGSGHAITALSKLLDNNVEVSLTSVNIIPFWEIPELFNNKKNNVFGIISNINEESQLTIVQVYSKDSIINLINNLTVYEKLSADKIKLLSDLDEFSHSIIKEIGSILAGHYSNSLADLLSTKLIPTFPQIALDNVNAMLNYIIAKYSQISDYSIIIKTMLEVKEIKLNGVICLIPNLNLLKNLFEILNIKYSMNL